MEHLPCDSLLPVDTDTNRAPLLFNVRQAPDSVVDLQNIRLLVRFQVKKFTAATETEAEKWEGLAPDDKVTLVNNFGHTLFEDVQLTVNGVLMETAQREYGYLAYLKNLLYSTSSSACETELFFHDKPGYLNRVVKDYVENRGEYVRSTIISNYEVVSAIIPIHLDLLRAPYFFPDNVGFSLRFYPAKTDSCLFQGHVAAPAKPMKVKVVIKHAELIVPRVQLNSSPKSITFDYESTKILAYTAPSSQMSFSQSLNLNRVPSKLAVVVLPEDQYTRANCEANPYYFAHNHVKNVTVHCNGKIYPSAAGLTTSSANNYWIEPYAALFSQLGCVNIPFTLDTMDNGYMIYGFDLSVEGKPPKFGNVSVDIQFEKAPDKNLTVLMFCFGDSTFAINNKGVISHDVDGKI